VERQRAATVQYQVLALAELHLSAAQQPQPAGLVDPVHPVVHGVGVDGFRILAFEAEEYRLAAAVAVTGGAERSEEFCPDRGGAGERAVFVQPGDEEAGGFHGPDGVGARRSDAHLEQVEDAERHAGSFMRWVVYGAKRCVKSNIEQGVGLSSGCLDKGLGPPSN
jgi:hypothetical protein